MDLSERIENCTPDEKKPNTIARARVREWILVNPRAHKGIAGVINALEPLTDIDGEHPDLIEQIMKADEHSLPAEVAGVLAGLMAMNAAFLDGQREKLQEVSEALYDRVSASSKDA